VIKASGVVVERLAELIARSDAEFDKRPYKGLGRADRTRYLERARLSAAIAAQFFTENSERLSDPGSGAAFNP